MKTSELFYRKNLMDCWEIKRFKSVYLNMTWMIISHWFDWRKVILKIWRKKIKLIKVSHISYMFINEKLKIMKTCSLGEKDNWFGHTTCRWMLTYQSLVLTGMSCVFLFMYLKVRWKHCNEKTVFVLCYSTQHIF